MVRIGIIGVGGIATSVHIPGLEKVKDCKITAICDIDEKQLKKVGDKLNIPNELRFTDYKALIACPEVDAVEICTPNHLHVPIAIEAIEAGKPVEVEKPLSIDLPSTEPLTEALAKNPVPNMMCFSYRFRPATQFAKWIMDKGLLGDIISVDVAYLKSSAFMEGRRLDWRFVKEYAGTGVLGDLGVHLIDMTRFLVGDLRSVCATKEIVVKQRKRLDSEELADVETDDYCSFLAELEGGVKSNFTITRCAIGNVNTIKYDIYGTEGMISFNLNDPNVLGVCIGEIDKKADGLHTVKVPKQFNALQEETFVKLASGMDVPHPTVIEDGIATQKILDAILLSCDERRWVDID